MTDKSRRIRILVTGVDARRDIPASSARSTSTSTANPAYPGFGTADVFETASAPPPAPTRRAAARELETALAARHRPLAGHRVRPRPRLPDAPHRHGRLRPRPRRQHRAHARRRRASPRDRRRCRHERRGPRMAGRGRRLSAERRCTSAHRGDTRGKRSVRVLSGRSRSWSSAGARPRSSRLHPRAPLPRGGRARRVDRGRCAARARGPARRAAPR